MYAPRYYGHPPGEPYQLTVGRVAILVVIALGSAFLGFLGGRSIGANEATPAALSSAPAAARDQALSTRLRSVPAIGGLDIPEPEPAPAATTSTNTDTFPTTPSQSAPQQSAPAPSPAPTPAPAPAPTPAPSGGGGGSFDDSG